MNCDFFFIIILFFGIGNQVVSQCPTEIYLSTQNQVDSFSITYPNCRQVNDLFITLSGDINNFKALKVLTGKQKDISILAYGKENVSFEGLENIDSIDYLGISQSKSTLGFSGVQYINYLFFQNDNNFNLSGFSSLKHINIFDVNAPSTENVPTFDLFHFPKIKNTNSLSLRGNFLLNGISNIDTIKRFVISSNFVLKDMMALSSRTSLPELVLGSVWTDFSFKGMEKIINLALLSIRNGKKILSLDGLKNVENIDFLSLDNINEFAPENMTELTSLQQINGLFIQNVSGLKSLDGFPASDTLHELFLKKNKHLTDISALNNVKNIGAKSFRWQSEQGIVISDNPNLSECSVVPVCDMLKTFPDSIKVIKNNGPKCINIDEVISHCISATSTTSFDNQKIFYPNPTYGHISVKDEIIIHEITNAQGVKVSISTLKNNIIDLSSQPGGIYFIHYTKNNMSSISKVIKI